VPPEILLGLEVGDGASLHHLPLSSGRQGAWLSPNSPSRQEARSPVFFWRMKSSPKKCSTNGQTSSSGEIGE
jgi:hypothetical protein